MPSPATKTISSKTQKPPRHRKSFRETETHTHTHKRKKQKEWGFVCCSCNRSGTNSRPTKRFPIGKRCRFGSCFIIIATQHRPQLKQKQKINDRKQIRRTKRSTKISGDWSVGREERPLRRANLCFLSSSSPPSPPLSKQIERNKRKLKQERDREGRQEKRCIRNPNGREGIYRIVGGHHVQFHRLFTIIPQVDFDTTLAVA